MDDSPIPRGHRLELIFFTGLEHPAGADQCVLAKLLLPPLAVLVHVGLNGDRVLALVARHAAHQGFERIDARTSFADEQARVVVADVDECALIILVRELDRVLHLEGLEQFFNHAPERRVVLLGRLVQVRRSRARDGSSLPRGTWCSATSSMTTSGFGTTFSKRRRVRRDLSRNSPPPLSHRAPTWATAPIEEIKNIMTGIIVFIIFICCAIMFSPPPPGGVAD